ncbi:hypothetical protein P872_17635 [Rhodonellum psychrophilum GCM71 = DSM 17998]|uniref:Uncharacterized protein n=1 Tax=Rhodonellum psychrophilum GCM71 = DSM 17998 TaxID=1123057 RepID=U5BZ84_9BACT|nr:hypothetical protein P872_17635 [Rhodonellum psychrophilum GCM71 = DSM 17998]
MEICIPFLKGVETARKSDHLGNKAWSRNGEVKNSKQLID